MSWADDYVTWLERIGVDFEIRSGWKRQSNGRGDWTHGVPVGTVDHHFVNPYSSKGGVNMIEDGYSGGPAPYVVCQYLEGTGHLYLVTSYPSGHPGKGSRAVLNRVMNDQAPLGDAADVGVPNDLPQSEAEKLYYGTETQGPGDGTPLPAAQMRALQLADAAFCLALGYTASRVIQHREHTDRKIDINKAALNSFNHRVAVAQIISEARTPKPVSYLDELLHR